MSHPRRGQETDWFLYSVSQRAKTVCGGGGVQVCLIKTGKERKCEKQRECMYMCLCMCPPKPGGVGFII